MSEGKEQRWKESTMAEPVADAVIQVCKGSKGCGVPRDNEYSGS